MTYIDQPAVTKMTTKGYYVFFSSELCKNVSSITTNTTTCHSTTLGTGRPKILSLKEKTKGHRKEKLRHLRNKKERTKNSTHLAAEESQSIIVITEQEGKNNIVTRCNRCGGVDFKHPVLV